MNDVTVLKFYSDRCTPCKVYAREFEKATSILGVKTAEINIDDEQNRALVERYDVKQIPYTVILKDEVPVEQFYGAIAGRRLTTRIEKAAQ